MGLSFEFCWYVVLCWKARLKSCRSASPEELVGCSTMNAVYVSVESKVLAAYPVGDELYVYLCICHDGCGMMISGFNPCIYTIL